MAEPADRVLTPAPLSAEAFAPFGDVIEASAGATTMSINRNGRKMITPI